MRGRLHWRQLDDEWVVRAHPSGSLFQLDDLSAAVLSLLEVGPGDEDALLETLAQGSGQPADATLRSALRLTLQRLVVDDLLADPDRP